MKNKTQIFLILYIELLVLRITSSIFFIFASLNSTILLQSKVSLRKIGLNIIASEKKISGSSSKPAIKKLTIAFFLMALLFCACKSKGETTVDTAAAMSLNDKTAVFRDTAAAMSPENDAGNISEISTDNDEGKARPLGLESTEPVLPVPSYDLPMALETVKIPSGTLYAGSRVDSTLRVQYAENDLVKHEMSAFEMDVLPYPNDPLRPFLTNVTRSEAENLCAGQSKRLCTELEWEWACKSSDNRRYPSGNQYNISYYPDEKRILPSSPFGVFAMGRILEWTTSAWGQEPDQVERAVAKGYADDLEHSDEVGRRCAMRWRRMSEGTNPSIGFRCCSGKQNKALSFIEPVRPPYSLYKTIKPAEFAGIIKSIPQLRDIHDNPHMFSEADIQVVLARRTSDRKKLAKTGIHFRWKPIRWIPRQGMELWVAVGRSNRHSFIVALHEVKNNEEYIHASSLVLWNQPIPLALVYREGHRDELYWGPCWGCRDGGKIAYDESKNEVIITNKW